MSINCWKKSVRNFTTRVVYRLSIWWGHNDIENFLFFSRSSGLLGNKKIRETEQGDTNEARPAIKVTDRIRGRNSRDSNFPPLVMMSKKHVRQESKFKSRMSITLFSG